MSLSIVRPGLLTTVQDLGRYGYQQQGVIVSGAMDTFALRAANILAGNVPGAAALEITLRGPMIRFEADALIAICGGDLSPTINGENVPSWRPVLVRAGEMLEFGDCRTGARTYLAVAGGIDVPMVLQSRSSYLRAGIGGHEGRALRAGDVLPVGAASNPAVSYMNQRSAALQGVPFLVTSWFVGYTAQPAYRPEPVIRFVQGREFKKFTPDSREELVNRRFRVTPQSDRMGYRLEGAALRLESSDELLSEAVSFGTIQVPPDGNPIILMADRQTVGGYPKIAQVASVDLPVLAQIKPGERIRFAEISLEEAQQLYISAELSLVRLATSIQLYMKTGGPR
ncbi:biotin-dependent carboxyltransferase family protein [Paenibacillus sp. SC116]|uniref:5-oxoprolinase subunit C family protein n=1 Tax=Paenibacillus sp. SC116 TaxID=2968986 RepID=UPI00215B502D|nr:biotin-dependent carboxyltransferase family protein [Paenibacillus sp. SC116]MCR8846390.1 biotin-dependent carboxyltransferase family protein [Paenibacillus sp. SC116]